MRARNFKFGIVLAIVIVTLFASAAVVKAAPFPFGGVWEATDTDGSHLRLTVSGGRTLRLAWIDDYWTLCDGGPGHGTGTAVVDDSTPYVMHAKLDFYCGNTYQGTFDIDFTYDPVTSTMTTSGDHPPVVWSRVGGRP